MTEHGRESNETVVEVKTELYGLEAIWKACYHFLEKLYIRLEGDPASVVLVKMRPKKEMPAEELKALSGEFENELIHQALRLKVSSSNQKIREYIVTRALAGAEGASLDQSSGPAGENQAQSPVLDEELEKEIEKLLAEVEKADPGEDPLKIAKSWEEKNEKEPAETKPVPQEKAS